MTSRTFFITGISSGLGRAFAQEALDAGHTVIGTVRTREQAFAFDDLVPYQSFGVVLDVREHARIPLVIAEAERLFGPIDVLINNAGYGVEGTVEESPLEELRRQMETNLFGVVSVTKAVLPGMRERRSGHIINVTSMGGLRAFPGLAYYHASKYAVEGFTDALRQEVVGFGIHVTSVEPGGFRTDWAGRSMRRVERSVPDYDSLIDPIRESRVKVSGHQLGDPHKAGRAILALIDLPTPPGHLVLGSDGLRLVRDARAIVDQELHTHEYLTVSTDGGPE